MHILALDFDGVLCDSSREVFVIAVDAYASLEPGSALLERLRPLRDDALGGGVDFRSDDLYTVFTGLLPLGNRAEDFGVSLKAIEDETIIEDQESYDTFYREIGQKWLDSFHHAFYAARSRLREADTGAWLELHLPYPGFAAVLRRHRARTSPAVATAKDARSVHLLLHHLGYSGVFDPGLILDKETGVKKTLHLEALRKRTGVDFDRITFVDDKVNHLVAVAALGVRPVLAGWGFNTPREHARARELGYAVATLNDAEAILFEGETE
jgi:phosphoglycolate phosphatase-like HAD superfamily hydrolase